MTTRKDAKGRNTVERLEYFSGAYSIMEKLYSNMNIHEKIITRTWYCGINHPSYMIKEFIEFQK
jgi:hypothetical protein